MARSTAKFPDNIWSFLLTSNMCALSGIAPWRRLHLHLMYGRMQLTPSGSVSWASAYRFRTHSIHSQWRITPRLEDLIRGSRNLNQVLHLPALSSLPASFTVVWKRACAPTRLQRITTSLPAASKVIWVTLENILRHGTGKPGSVIVKIAAWSSSAGLSTPVHCVRHC